MQLTRAADYAIRVMIHMASLPPGTRMSLTAIAAEIDVPESFLSKVLQALTRAGLLTSRRGTDGGFELGPGASTASMLDVIQIIEGPMQLNYCLQGNHHCPRLDSCATHAVWVKAQQAVVDVLGSAMIGELARSQSNLKVAHLKGD
jgi:Rrf2 family protein